MKKISKKSDQEIIGKNKNFLLLTISSLILAVDPTSGKAASCTYGSCSIADSSASEIIVSGSNTKAEFSAPDVTVNATRNGKNIKISKAGEAKFKGDLTVKMNSPNLELYQATALNIRERGRLEVDGNFTVSGSPIANSPGLIRLNDAEMYIKGDTLIRTINASSGAAIHLTGNSKATFGDNTTIIVEGAPFYGMALSVQDTSEGYFKGLTIEADNNFSLVANNKAIISSTDQTVIKNIGTSGDAIRLQGNSLVSLGDSTNKIAEMLANPDRPAQLHIGKDASVSTEGRAAIYLAPDTHGSIVTIEGSVIANRDNGAEAIKSGRYIRDDHVYLQGGNVVGDVQLRKGDDSLNIQSGKLVGDVYMGEGDDKVVLTGGRLDGAIYMGAGNDYFEASGGKIVSPIVDMEAGENKAYITGDADISGLSRLSGGAVKAMTNGNTSQLIFEKGEFSAWSQSSLRSNSVELVGWTHIDLKNKANLTVTGPALQVFDVLSIDTTSTLQSLGNLTISGNDTMSVNNSGLLNLQNNRTNETWLISGNYTGIGGRISLDTTLNGDASPTDKVIIAGDTSGSTLVHVNNVGGLGAQTIKGIEIIEVQGNSAGIFQQDGRIVSGAYDYSLARGNPTNGTDQSNWYLTSYSPPTPVIPPPVDPNPPTPVIPPPVDPSPPTPVIPPPVAPNPPTPVMPPPVDPNLPTPVDPQSSKPVKPNVRPESGSYLSLIENQGVFNHSFHDRQQLLDNRYKSVWTRFEFNRNKSKSDGNINNRNNQDIIQLGTDLYQDNQLHWGIMGGYARSNIKSRLRTNGYDSKAKSNGYTIGTYGTWFDQIPDKGGLYLDGYALYNRFNNSVTGRGLKKEKYHSNGYTLSAEIGYGILVKQNKDLNWLIEPQAQLIYNDFNGKTHTERNGTRVRLGGVNNLTSRLGLRVQGKKTGFQPFVTLNYWHNSDIATIRMNETRLKGNKAKDLFEVKAGGQIAIKGNFVVFGQAVSVWGKQSTKKYGGNVGVKYQW